MQPIHYSTYAQNSNNEINKAGLNKKIGKNHKIIDSDTIGSDFFKEYGNLNFDVDSHMKVEPKNLFEEFKKLVKENYGDQFNLIKIAQTALFCIQFEKNYFNALLDLIKLLDRLKLLIKESNHLMTGIKFFSEDLKHTSVFSYEELDSLTAQETAFCLKYLEIVENKSIRVKLITDLYAIEDLRNYWKHNNPKIALEAKKVYCYLSAALINLKFSTMSEHQNIIGNYHYSLHFAKNPELKNPSMPEFTPLALKKIIPVSVSVFADLNELVNTSESTSSSEDNNPLSHDKKYKEFLNTYLKVQNFQEKLYEIIYKIFVEEKKSAFRKKTFSQQELLSLSELPSWVQTNLKAQNNHILLSSKLEKPLEYKENQFNAFSNIENTQKTDLKAEIKLNPINVTPKKKKKKKNRKTTENHSKTPLILNNPKQEKKFTLPLLSPAELAIQQLHQKSAFQKVFRVRRWENLIDSIPENNLFPEYADTKDPHSRLMQIKRHAFEPAVDKLLHDKRYAFKTNTGFALLAHVKLDEKTEEYSLICYGLNQKKQMYHRYIHTLGRNIFQKNILETIKEVKISESISEQESKEDCQSRSIIVFDPLSSIFTFTDTIRNMTINIFPIPESCNNTL